MIITDLKDIKFIGGTSLELNGRLLKEREIAVVFTLDEYNSIVATKIKVGIGELFENTPFSYDAEFEKYVKKPEETYNNIVYKNNKLYTQSGSTYTEIGIDSDITLEDLLGTNKVLTSNEYTEFKDLTYKVPKIKSFQIGTPSSFGNDKEYNQSVSGSVTFNIVLENIENLKSTDNLTLNISHGSWSGGNTITQTATSLSFNISATLLSAFTFNGLGTLEFELSIIDENDEVTDSKIINVEWKDTIYYGLTTDDQITDHANLTTKLSILTNDVTKNQNGDDIQVSFSPNGSLVYTCMFIPITLNQSDLDIRDKNDSGVPHSYGMVDNQGITKFKRQSILSGKTFNVYLSDVKSSLPSTALIKKT